MPTEKIPVYAPPGIPATMVAAYIQRCLASLSDAEAALDGLDHNALRVYAHRLKGSGGGYGIPRLTEIGSVMEEAAKRSDSAELQSQLAALEIYLNRLETVPD
jgi:HPt (histidine-containing phosphotransfer) domain-containing protein